MSVYLDASVILPTLFKEPSSAIVDEVLTRFDEPLLISEFATAEVASALSRLVRMGLLQPGDAAERLADFDAWRAAASDNLDIKAADVRLANVFVRRLDLRLRAPNALHAAACQREDLLMATRDRRLARAAEELGVRVRLVWGRARFDRRLTCRPNVLSLFHARSRCIPRRAPSRDDRGDDGVCVRTGPGRHRAGQTGGP